MSEQVLTPKRLRELRCPKCGETDRHYWCRCGTLIKGTVCPMCDRTREAAMNRERADDSIPLACGTEITPDGRVILEGEVCLRRQRDAARAEAERWRKRYEALRADIERILKEIEAAPKPEEFIPTNPDEMIAELLYVVRDGKGHNKGFANGLWVAGMMLRGLLAEAGGGSQ